MYVYFRVYIQCSNRVGVSIFFFLCRLKSCRLSCGRLRKETEQKIYKNTRRGIECGGQSHFRPISVVSVCHRLLLFDGTFTFSTMSPLQSKKKTRFLTLNHFQNFFFFYLIKQRVAACDEWTCLYTFESSNAEIYRCFLCAKGILRK